MLNLEILLKLISNFGGVWFRFLSNFMESLDLFFICSVRTNIIKNLLCIRHCSGSWDTIGNKVYEEYFPGFYSVAVVWVLILEYTKGHKKIVFKVIENSMLGYRLEKEKAPTIKFDMWLQSYIFPN